MVKFMFLNFLILTLSLIKPPDRMSVKTIFAAFHHFRIGLYLSVSTRKQNSEGKSNFKRVSFFMVQSLQHSLHTFQPLMVNPDLLQSALNSFVFHCYLKMRILAWPLWCMPITPVWPWPPLNSLWKPWWPPPHPDPASLCLQVLGLRVYHNAQLILTLS